MYTCLKFILIHFVFTCVGSCRLTRNKDNSKFQVEREWSFINFTWENENVYREAVVFGKYIPENNAMTGIKFYKDKFYIAMPRIREGTPVTLGYIVMHHNTLKQNPLITPFPDWQTNNVDGNCNMILESVQSMEIDAKGIMWVIDGHRTRSAARCPPKLVLYDINNEAKVVHIFIFPETVCSSKGCFLNDIVVDDQDGGFAYMTDNGVQDPGLIVYSRMKNRAWKLRDASMFAEIDSSKFVVDSLEFSALSPIDGIALSPKYTQSSRVVYFCALAGVNLYSISTNILKDENGSSRGEWRHNVTYIGSKPAQTDGMVVDNEGNLYHGLLPLYAVGSWNINEDFSNAHIIDCNNETMIWNDSFAFDNKGYLYLLANHIHRYFNRNFNLEMTHEIKFRILKLFTSKQSYLY